MVGRFRQRLSRAREALATDNNSLLTAFGDYDREQADMAMEAALGSRSVERAVEEVLLPTLEQVIRERSVDSAAWAFAAPWGADWLRRATRLAPPLWRPLSIFVGDASRDGLDPDALHILALELFCMRAGVKIMSLSARGIAGIRDAFDVHRPDLVVLAGATSWPTRQSQAGRTAVRLAAGPMPIALYRRGDHLTDMPTTGTIVLPSRATDAQQRLLELVETSMRERRPRRQRLANDWTVVSPGQRATFLRRQTPPGLARVCRCRCGSLARIRFRLSRARLA